MIGPLPTDLSLLSHYSYRLLSTMSLEPQSLATLNSHMGMGLSQDNRYELHDLHRWGLCQPHKMPGKRPQVQLWTITPAGEDVLNRLFEQRGPIPTVEQISDAVLAMCCAEFLPASDIRERLMQRTRITLPPRLVAQYLLRHVEDGDVAVVPSVKGTARNKNVFGYALTRHGEDTLDALQRSA